MSDAVVEERRLALIRFEHAAGAAFGCEVEPLPAPRPVFVPAAIALATLAATVAAAITYLA